MLEDVVGRVEASREHERPEIARSPGQMAKHYSPRTPVRLVDSMAEAMMVSSDEYDAGKRVGLVLMRPDIDDDDEEEGPNADGRIHLRYLPNDPAECAARLYDILHDLDRLNLDVLVIDLPPDDPEWAAVRDRLTRAAGE
jgi:L-threonylcarbamoyladenylate synthase